MVKKYLKRLFYRLRANYTTEHLIEMGLVVGKNFNRMHDVILDPSHCWLIQIGDNVTMAPRVHVLAHDASTKVFLDYTKIGRVNIGNNVFIGAETVILPNVKIGDNVVIGANSTVSKDIPSGSVYAGSPAKFICTIDEFLKKNQDCLSSKPKFEDEYTLREGINSTKKQEMINALKETFGYVH